MPRVKPPAPRAPEQEELKNRILEDTERLAAALEGLSDIGDILRTTRLKKKAILLLLSNYSKVSQRDIEAVLDALAEIRHIYLK